MKANNVNNLYSFEWLNVGGEKKELVQNVYRAFMNLFSAEGNISFVKIKGGLVLQGKVEGEITYYKNRKRETKEVDVPITAEELAEAWAVLHNLSSASTGYLDDSKQYHVYRSGSEQYFEFNIFDKQFIDTDRLLEIGFLTEDFLDYALETVFSSKKIVVYGQLCSGKTTMLETLSQLMQQHLLLVFQRNQEIRNNHNTMVRVNYNEMTDGEELNKHLYSLFKMNPDYIILDNPRNDLVTQHSLFEVFPFLLSLHGKDYEEVVRWHNSFPTDGTNWCDLADVFIGLENQGNGNYRIKEVREKAKGDNATQVVFQYNPETDTLDKV